jgi:hypothetical protein
LNRIFSGIMLTILLTSMLTLTFNIHPVKADNGLIKSPWPMFQHDPQHTGRSPFTGPSNGSQAQVFLGNETIDDIFGSPVIDSDGTLYFGAKMKSKSGLYAFSSNSTQKWFYETASAGLKSPALLESAHSVYTFSSWEVLAVNTENGTLKWKKSFVYIYDTLVIGDDEILYFTAARLLPDSSYRTHLIGLDKNGTEVLSYDIGEIGPECSSPTIDKEGIIYFGYNETLFAINANGTEKWQRTFEADIKYHTPSPPIVTTPSIADDGTIYVVVFCQSDWRTGTDQGWHNHLHAVDPENPSIDKWERGYVYSYGFTRPGVPPAIDFEGNVYVTMSYYVPGSGSHKVVLVYTPEGKLKISMDLTGGFLLVDVQNTVYSLGRLTPSAASLRIFDSEGNETIVTLPYQEGSRQPFLSLASDGTLYIGGHKNLYAVKSTVAPPYTPDFSIEASPTSLTIQQGSSDTSVITVMSIGGFNQPVQLTVSGAPSGVTATLDPEQVTPPPDGSTTSTLTVSVATTATPGSYTLTVTGTNGTLTHNIDISLEIANPPPICSIKLQKEGIEIDEVDRTEFFDIYVGDSSDDTGIKEVRFSSDDVQDDVPTGEWTEGYNWSVSSGDWNASTKIKRWAFHTYGYKEVWAQVTDDAGQTANCSATIFVPAPALPVITSPLVITPVKDIYCVGDPLEAEFTIKNIGDIPITLDILTLGGRLNGRCPDDVCPDFTHQSVTLQPNESDQYQGSFTPTQKGNYRFFIAYHINNPTQEEKTLLDENNWNTCVELGEGLNHTNRVKNIIVYEEGTVPEEVSQLRDTINRLIEQDIVYPTYLLDPEVSWAASIWMSVSSIFTSAQEEYDMLWYTGVDYDGLKFKALVFADRLLESGKVEGAKKFLQMSYEFAESSVKSFNAATEIYDQNLNIAETTARFIREACQAIVVGGVSVINPTAAKFLDYIFIITDYYIDKELIGEEQARKIAVRDTIVTTVFNEIPFFDGKTMEEYVDSGGGRKLIHLPRYIKPHKNLPVEIYDAIKHIGVGCAQELSTLISDKLGSGVDYLEEKVFSPVELRVYDSGGKITGVIRGEVRHEISRSAYSNGTVMIYFPSDSYTCEVTGKEEGTYGLEITSVEAGNATTFNAIDIPTLLNATHQYAIDWEALPIGEEGVTVQVDSNGDDIFEHTFTSDSELTQSEFLAQITLYIFSIIWGEETFIVSVESNSTVSNFAFNQPDKEISFNVTGPDGTIGFCNVTIPKALLYAEPWTVLIDGAPMPPTITENETHSCLYFTYTHSTHKIEIIGTWVIPPPPPPLSISISPLSASILVGQSVTFTSTVSGGVTPYSYQWYLNGNPVSGATSDTWTFTPTTSGIYYVYLKVTDDIGNTTQSETARITVTTVPVGGYSVPIQLPTTAKPATIHIALLTILTAIFITIKRKAKRKH